MEHEGLIRRGESKKFRRDKWGGFWEDRGDIDGFSIWAPAPDWAGNINFYIFEGPNIFIETQSKPLCDVPEMRTGAMPIDDGNFLLTTEEKDELLRTDPHAGKFIRPFMNGKEFINRIPRWCLWLKDAEPADVRKCPRVLERIERVREFRKKSTRGATKRLADTPMLFADAFESKTNYLAIPKTSSETRKYIPMAWLTPDIIAGDALFVCDGVSLYHFGVLMSSVHMAWVRCISGRLTSRLRYSTTLDYNAFPWPERPKYPVPPERFPEGNPYKVAIEKSAQAILDARAKYPRSSLADLYDERTMPPELRKAHNDNDEAVMAAYGFTRHYEDAKMHDEDITIALMYMYKDLTGCDEPGRKDYPNRPLWVRYCPEDADDDELENLELYRRMWPGNPGLDGVEWE